MKKKTAKKTTSKSASVAVSSKVASALAKHFNNGGWVQAPPDAKARSKRGSEYKRGYEIRIAVASTAELATLRKLLAQAGFKPSSSFKKVNRIVQPIYGKEAVKRFMDMVKKSR